MKASLCLLLASIVVNPIEAFAPALTTTSSPPIRAAASASDRFSVSLCSSTNDQLDGNDAVGRRDALSQATKFAAGLALALNFPSASYADDASPKVVVAGATGQTGRRVLERLAQAGNLQVIGGVRNVDKATASLEESSTVVRGAMVQKVASVDTSAVDLQRLDVVKDSVDELAKTMEGATSLVIATGFIPGNPLKMNAAAHDVDNIGTIKLIDAAKKTGSIKKIVMVSSILTNGRNWGQEKSPGFVITNAFGNVLDEKLVAENYLKQSGIDYTIVRPGGLKAKPPTGALQISGEDTLNSGEISRDLVADVCVASLADAKAKNKVLEIIEDEGTPPKVFNGLNM